jgi:hypothetical protein
VYAALAIGEPVLPARVLFGRLQVVRRAAAKRPLNVLNGAGRPSFSLDVGGSGRSCGSTLQLYCSPESNTSRKSVGMT